MYTYITSLIIGKELVLFLGTAQHWKKPMFGSSYVLRGTSNWTVLNIFKGPNQVGFLFFLF
jgi:hypothetical protein